eukprot:CAMPEP_0170625034 /NCGR_PEP_ID=MMETSP0224-20130122/30549_1 /TAXON_ID=285029 /ORGANISM="Togula jolla, Strain CCCM 725" /LENGTH=108 /DNA_ID=CAMNT_0010951593 /DNA_START=31 /DNA_END=353 /DNA_ORIENTATION=-
MPTTRPKATATEATEAQCEAFAVIDVLSCTGWNSNSWPLMDISWLRNALVGFVPTWTKLCDDTKTVAVISQAATTQEIALYVAMASANPVTALPPMRNPVGWVPRAAP